ncbi:hypothetical protein K435DRAFT_195726 [Dendrothele bispora CBS 962.96]|uniref:Uncharacterized protein n=1 Tax=Dendrothele bispora (strain CBS 962.96) TaxID=1314807 RepID=A0A4S8MN87_DENBC|nr:hypothetical protein K435DRAFT_195726 [Dendrothele bispora CBS 962.96]
MATPEKYHSLEILTSCVHFASASAIAFCLSRRIPPFTSWKSWKNLSWSRLCVILVLLDSWFFVVFSGILMNGVGTTWNLQACTIAICICISVYVLSKMLIYSFLSERVYIVWSGGNQVRRLQSPVYRICCIVLVGFIVVAVFMVIGRETHIRQDGVCVIGLKQSVGIGLVVYDLFLNVFLTVMFLWPLWGSSRSGVKISPKLRTVAKRTLCHDKPHLFRNQHLRIIHSWR